MKEKSKFVLYRNPEHGNVFWTLNTGEHEGLEVLHYGDTSKEMVAEWKKHYRSPSIKDLLN